MLHLYLLGSFRLERDGKPVRLATHKVESLFAYLALQPEPHPREKLAALIWGDATDERARTSLRNALSALRRSLGDVVLLADRQSIQLNPEYRLWADVREFGEIEDLGRCVDLYRGDLLADFYDDWIAPEREKYHALYLTALLGLAQSLRSQSEYERAIEVAQKILAHDPASEKAHQHLMFCYVVTGRRSVALKQYETYERLLRDEYAAEPLAETRALYEWIKQASAPNKSREALLTNLPIPLSSFVGRNRETAEIKRLVAPPSQTTPASARPPAEGWRPEAPGIRLVTLTGPGGCGKTRLAIQAATDLVDAFRDGVWWVELAGLSESSLVAPAVARALGVQEASMRSAVEILLDYLRPRQILLVLDNCEHLITACARLSEALLRFCPQLKILATSREALAFTGEMAWPVPSLSLPEPEEGKAGGPLRPPIGDCESVRLFIERAGAVKPGFGLTEQNAPAVAQICRRLDGIPLAIELAAARVKTLTVDQIASRLDDRFNLLAMGSRTALPRHQTLRAAIDWSYDLLGPEEQRVLRSLSVFAGGFALEAAEEVMRPRESPSRADPLPTSIDLLSQLVNKSLVSAADARYQMLETIREYARGKLLASGEAGGVRDRHFDFFLQMAQRAAPELVGANQALWLNKLETDHDNFRAALLWALEREGVANDEAALRLAAALWRFWLRHSYLSEGRQWLERALARSGAAGSVALKAHALRAQGTLSAYLGDQASACEQYQKSLAMFRQLDDHSGVAQVLSNLGYALWFQGNYDSARSAFEQGLLASEEVGDRGMTGLALTGLGSVAWSQSDYTTARSCLERGLTILSELGHQQFILNATLTLGHVARMQGEHAEAHHHFRAGLRLARELGNKANIAVALESLALLAIGAQPERAARLLSTADKLRQAIGSTLRPYGDPLADLRALGKQEALTAAWAEGSAMALEQAVQYALQDDEKFSFAPR